MDVNMTYGCEYQCKCGLNMKIYLRRLLSLVCDIHEQMFLSKVLSENSGATCQFSPTYKSAGQLYLITDPTDAHTLTSEWVECC